jgi:hypothetical protein
VADELAGHRRRVEILGGPRDVARVADVDVAGEDDGIRDVAGRQQLGDAAPVGDVAVPLVGAELAGAVAVALDVRREGNLLGEHVPARVRVGEAVQQPPQLDAAEHRARLVERLGAVAGRVAQGDRTGLGLVGAVLARVEHVEPGEGAPVDATVQPEVGTGGPRRAAQRHVLVVGLVGRRAARQPLVAGHVGIGVLVGVVVLDLVVVPGHQERKTGMRGAQARVRLVLRVTDPIVREAADLVARLVQPRVRGIAGTLVDVVAEMHDEVEVLCRDVAPRRVVAVGVVLTRGEGELQRVHGAGDRRGSRATGRALREPDLEPVPVPRARPQARARHGPRARTPAAPRPRRGARCA